VDRDGDGDGVWGDEEELDALADPDAEAEPGEHYDRPIDRFRRTTGGAVLAAGLLGIADALEGRKVDRDEPAIVQEAPAGQAPDWLDLRLDFDDPDKSRVVIRRPPPPD
jgi:hypothetical protein